MTTLLIAIIAGLVGVALGAILVYIAVRANGGVFAVPVHFAQPEEDPNQ